MDSVAGFFWDDHNPRATSVIDNSAQRSSEALRNGGKQSETKNDRKGSASSIGASSGLASTTQQLLADKLVEKIIYMALPPSSDLAKETIVHRVEAGKNRPGLSVPIMSRNFIQMNSRLSVPFMIIDEIIRIFNWSNPAYTLSVMSLYTYAVLKPLPTLASAPIFYLLFGVMVPQYLKIHKPDPNPALGTSPIPASGPPLLKAEVPKPVPEFSKEFILNLTDLQNHMMIYVVIFDFINSILSKFAFFTDESISSVCFLVLLVLACFNALFMDSIARFLPIRMILVVSGWLIVMVLHPQSRDHVLSKFTSEETRLKVLTITNKAEKVVDEYFRYYEPREKRQASIFELQKYNDKNKAWELVGYSTDHYTILSDLRVSEGKIEDSAQSLEEVKPPIEWVWMTNSKWVLDLDPLSWVETEFVQYVEVDTGTKWVYDANFDGTKGEFRRRRWIRICTREAEDAILPRNKGTSEEGVDFQSQMKDCYNGYETNIQMNSAYSNNEQRNRDNSLHASDGMVKSTSNNSIASETSGLSNQESTKSNISVSNSSKAVKSLTDFLSLAP
ncbi:LAFE_0D08504g1_1 [Lachancea fermentati]|uniref:LAFE_0D08504g1_1 n=1 Tax=Lachancea fermentati TaxID=4955 RepID=A0A1G4MBS2_LACFM|nr:LAFE_0D08504g1_1 [Lachancea fermentati]